jgi:hypothetical protein
MPTEQETTPMLVLSCAWHHFYLYTCLLNMKGHQHQHWYRFMLGIVSTFMHVY